MIDNITRFGLLSLLIISIACGSSSSDETSTTDTTENSDSIPTTTTSLKEFTLESGPIETQLTSTCTIYDNNEYKMYRLNSGGIHLMTSTDGLTFTTSQSTGIQGQAGTFEDFIRNPSVIKLASGNYIMIYEGLDPSHNPKLFRAISTDGLNFTKYTGTLTDGGLLEPTEDEKNFMSVPDMIEINGTIHLYYVAASIKIFHATSTDEGITWTRLGEIPIENTTSTDRIVDPDIIQLSDGTYRMFFAFTNDSTKNNFGYNGIHTATSTDAHNFTYEGLAFPTTEGQSTLDPDVVLQKDSTTKYRMYYGHDLTTGNRYDLYSAVSE